VALPALGATKPQSMRMMVDLPEPFGPRKPNISPSSTARFTRSTAVKFPKRIVNWSATMAGI
jgi:hypothetical protein